MTLAKVAHPTQPDIKLVLFSLIDCVACEGLKKEIQRVISDPVYRIIAFDTVHYGTLEADRYPTIRPRVFPTVIAFSDTEARLGWEGFASMAPSDISDSIIREALDATLSLASIHMKNQLTDK